MRPVLGLPGLAFRLFAVTASDLELAEAVEAVANTVANLLATLFFAAAYRQLFDRSVSRAAAGREA